LTIPGPDPAFAAPERAVPLFTGMLVQDAFAVYMRGVVLLFLVLLAVFARISGVPDRDDATEFFVLALGAALGMCLMVSANHMLIVFLGVEMASVPSYALAGILKNRRTSSEAALKFAVFGAGTAGVMLYGISLLVGILGSAHLPTMASKLAALLQTGAGAEQSVVLVLGGLMIAVGLAFKLSAVPFHFWTPDVFEGAAAEVGAFLSVASKAAALGLVVRLAMTFGRVEPKLIVGIVAILAAVTCTFGNLAAYGQTNMKRLLAYSTIAHAGYLMMPVAAAVAVVGTSPALAEEAIASLAFYVAVYLFMNLGAFAGTAFLRNTLRSEQIADYAGLIRTSTGLAVCMAVILFSLVGLPPLAGFSAKFTIFASLFNAISATPMGGTLTVLLLVGVLNTVLSLFYYLRVVRAMIVAPGEERPSAPTVALSSPAGLYCLAMTAPLVVLFLWWGPFPWAAAAARSLL
jgi:NADH-quinone oxidoreductase subunit N